MKVDFRINLFFIQFIFFVLIIAGCSRTIPPPPAPSPPSVQSRHTDQLIKGIRAYEAGRYDEAERLFSQMIASKPSAPLLMEARWHLAKSYVALGKKDLANDALADFLETYPKSAYEEEARAMLHRQVPTESTKVIAITWQPEKTSSLKTALSSFSEVSVDTIFLEISNKQLIKSAKAPLESLSDDPLFIWIDMAKKMGLRVFLSVPLRVPIHTTVHVLDRLVQKSRSKNDLSEKNVILDLFDPEVKKELLLFYRNIARYSWDGIYLHQIGYGLEEESTSYIALLYQDSFSEKLEIERLFEKERTFGPVARRRPASSQFWRLNGMKSRYLADLLRQIHLNINGVNSQTEFGIEIPEILLIDPARGMVETALDYIALRDAAFDFYLVASTGTHRRRLLESLSRYGGGDRAWFVRADGETVSSLVALPVQGVVLSKATD
ncbi:MAG: tetratricopeptide repeat protein [Nitrospirota bacterium]